MGDNRAVLEGFTREVHIDNAQGGELYLLVQPNADLDQCFKAWDMDAQQYIQVNGWLFAVSYDDANGGDQ